MSTARKSEHAYILCRYTLVHHPKDRVYHASTSSVDTVTTATAHSKLGVRVHTSAHSYVWTCEINMLSMKGHTNTDYMRAGGGQRVCTALDNNNDACTCEANRANVNTNHACIETSL